MTRCAINFHWACWKSCCVYNVITNFRRNINQQNSTLYDTIAVNLFSEGSCWASIKNVSWDERRCADMTHITPGLQHSYLYLNIWHERSSATENKLQLQQICDKLSSVECAARKTENVISYKFVVRSLIHIKRYSKCEYQCKIAHCPLALKRFNQWLSFVISVSFWTLSWPWSNTLTKWPLLPTTAPATNQWTCWTRSYNPAGVGTRHISARLLWFSYSSSTTVYN